MKYCVEALNLSTFIQECECSNFSWILNSYILIEISLCSSISYVSLSLALFLYTSLFECKCVCHFRSQYFVFNYISLRLFSPYLFFLSTFLSFSLFLSISLFSISLFLPLSVSLSISFYHPLSRQPSLSFLLFLSLYPFLFVTFSPSPLTPSFSLSFYFSFSPSPLSLSLMIANPTCK